MYCIGMGGMCVIIILFAIDGGPWISDKTICQVPQQSPHTWLYFLVHSGTKSSAQHPMNGLD